MHWLKYFLLEFSSQSNVVQYLNSDKEEDSFYLHENEQELLCSPVALSSSQSLLQILIGTKTSDQIYYRISFQMVWMIVTYSLVPRSLLIPNMQQLYWHLFVKMQKIVDPHAIDQAGWASVVITQFSSELFSVAPNSSVIHSAACCLLTHGGKNTDFCSLGVKPSIFIIQKLSITSTSRQHAVYSVSDRTACLKLSYCVLHFHSEAVSIRPCVCKYFMGFVCLTLTGFSIGTY